MLQLIPQKYRFIRDYYEQLDANKFDTLDKMDKFLETKPIKTES